MSLRRPRGQGCLERGHRRLVREPKKRFCLLDLESSARRCCSSWGWRQSEEESQPGVGSASSRPSVPGQLFFRLRPSLASPPQTNRTLAPTREGPGPIPQPSHFQEPAQSPSSPASGFWRTPANLNSQALRMSSPRLGSFSGPEVSPSPPRSRHLSPDTAWGSIPVPTASAWMLRGPRSKPHSFSTRLHCPARPAPTPLYLGDSKVQISRDFFGLSGPPDLPPRTSAKHLLLGFNPQSPPHLQVAGVPLVLSADDLNPQGIPRTTHDHQLQAYLKHWPSPASRSELRLQNPPIPFWRQPQVQPGAQRQLLLGTSFGSLHSCPRPRI